MDARTRPRVVLLCDGTWCGRETGTSTNIYRLAQLMDVDVDNPNTTDAQFRSPNAFTPPTRHVFARYRHGVGLGSSFVDYLFNAVTANDLEAEVIACYRYVVEHYTPSHDIWMFGISRGAYTVRCVAGMINNCGILRRHDLSNADTDLLCHEAYRMYRSTDPVNDPHSKQMEAFRERRSWPLIGDESKPGQSRPRPPVRFMGLFDTVGSLGIPNFTGGVGFEWPEFHSDVVSSVVQDVCHLVSLHDRFYIFQPCLVHRKDGGRDGIDEEWLPGVHYDLARQRFQFWRSGAGWLERLVGWVQEIPLLGTGKSIKPNEVLSDLALWRMLKRIGEHDEGNLLISQAVLVAEMANLARKMTDSRRQQGSGDVYANIAEYGPFGSPIGRLITRVAGETAAGVWGLFTELRVRVIPDDGANVYLFSVIDASIPGVQSVGQLADVTEARYPSKTARAWALRSGQQSSADGG